MSPKRTGCERKQRKLSRRNHQPKKTHVRDLLSMLAFRSIEKCNTISLKPKICLQMPLRTQQNQEECVAAKPEMYAISRNQMLNAYVSALNLNRLTREHLKNVERNCCVIFIMFREKLLHFFIRMQNVNVRSIHIFPKKKQSIIKRLISFTFKTTYLDVSHALNHIRK